MSFIELTNPAHFSRLLYANPVCILTTSPCTGSDSSVDESCAGKEEAVCEEEDGINDTAELSPVPPVPPLPPPSFLANTMILSWLTPSDNAGSLIFSLCAGRYSARAIADHLSEFVLSIPVAGMEQTVLRCGQGTGNPATSPPAVATPHCTNKLASPLITPYSLPPTPNPLPLTTVHHAHFTLPGCVAVLIVQPTALLSSPPPNSNPYKSHYTISATVRRAWVRTEYWDGKVLAPTTPTLPGVLSFLGSQRFGEVVPCKPREEDDKR